MNDHCYTEAEIPPVLSVDSLSSILHVGKGAVYNLVRSGQIKSVRVGKHIRISRTAVLQFLDSVSI